MQTYRTDQNSKLINVIKYSLFIMMLTISSLMAQEYAFIYIDGNSETNSVGTSWTNVGAGLVTDFTESTSSTNWSYTSNVLTAANNASVEGNYCIKYSLSFNADATVWYMGISIDGAAPVEPVFTRSISNDRKDTGNMSGIFMVSITQGQTIEMVVKSSLAAQDFTPVYAQLSVCPAAQNPENLYSGMHINSSTTYTDLGTSFAKLTGFSAISEINGWTFGTSDLTADAGSGGLYYMSYSISFTGDGNETSPGLFTFELVKNGVNGSTNIMVSRSTSSEDIGNISAGGLVSISDGDVMSLEAKASNSTYDPTIKKATLSMFKLGDTAPNAVGGMKITSDQSVTIVAQDTWTTVGDYTLKSANLWELNSNVFSLNSTNAYGYYYIEFSTSFSTANASGDDVELGVFVGTSVNPNLTVKRRLSSNTDVGGACGVGLFKVDGPDSTITLKIQNTTSSNNITIKKSLVGFSQIRYVYSDTPLPISLSSFDIEKLGKSIRFSWQTASEIENLGYKIYRKENDGIFEEISSYAYNDALRGQGTTTDMHDYEFIDINVEPGKEYSYLLADISYQIEENKHHDYIRKVYIPVGIEVGDAYPNPFNPVCIIPFSLDTDRHVTVQLHDVSGRKIKTITDKHYTAGTYDITVNDPSLSSGLYFVRVNSGNKIETRKILMMR